MGLDWKMGKDGGGKLGLDIYLVGLCCSLFTIVLCFAQEQSTALLFSGSLDGVVLTPPSTNLYHDNHEDVELRSCHSSVWNESLGVPSVDTSLDVAKQLSSTPAVAAAETPRHGPERSRSLDARRRADRIAWQPASDQHTAWLPPDPPNVPSSYGEGPYRPRQPPESAR